MPRRTASQSTMLTGGTWLVPTVNLILVCDRFRREGLPTANLWVGTGMTEAICADPDALVSYEQAVAFFTNAVDQYPGEALGLQIGQRETPTAWGVLGFAMLSCQRQEEGSVGKECGSTC